MKTAIERFVEWLEEHHPHAVPTPEVLEHLKMLEKIDQQMAYNAGFSNAKNIYDGKTDNSTANHS